MFLQQHHSRLLRREAGFTILELIMVIGILGALAAVGTTAILAELRSQRVLAATNELAGWLEAVRGAAERGIACIVDIPDKTTATNQIVATATPKEATIPNHCLQNIPFRIESDRAFDRYSIDSNINTFTFTPRGSVFLTGGGEVIQVRIQAVEGEASVGTGRCVRVEPPLGLIEVGACEEI